MKGIARDARVRCGFELEPAGRAKDSSRPIDGFRSLTISCTLATSDVLHEIQPRFSTATKCFILKHLRKWLHLVTVAAAATLTILANS